MKLNKIASLALAGVMAASMLAGCGNTESNTDNGGVVSTGTSSVVSAVNDGQSATNDVKVTFAADSVLDKALKAAVEAYGDTVDLDTLATAVMNMTGVQYIDVDDLWDENEIAPGEDNATFEDGDSQTALFAIQLNSVNKDAALNATSNALDQVIAGLVDTTKADNQVAGSKYWNYSYKGSISMISVERANGSVTYYVVGTVTQTATEKTWEK